MLPKRSHQMDSVRIIPTLKGLAPIMGIYPNQILEGETMSPMRNAFKKH
jgi:hypothetical protein